MKILEKEFNKIGSANIIVVSGVFVINISTDINYFAKSNNKKIGIFDVFIIWVILRFLYFNKI